MQTLYKLYNQVKNYDWGSPLWIPELLGKDNGDKAPWAELWMGAHPSAASHVVLDGKEINLIDLLQENPEESLGISCAKEFGSLPFLFKLLAAAKPLSIQAHPTLEQAEEGWKRENDEGLDLNSPLRNYKDSNHKPEILCAMSPFKALCGFRQINEISSLLGLLDNAALQEACETLKRPNSKDALSGFLTALFKMPRATRSQFCQDVRAKAAALQIKDAEHADVWAMVQSLSLAYPEDPAIIAPLYLNVLNLLAGQAIYLPAGILHAYVEGFGVELMAASDNVLRGGLTTKHIDLAELQKVLSFEPYYPKILGPAPLDLDRYTYQSPSKEFSLTVLRSTKKNVEINEGEPHIIVVTEGTASLKDDSGIEIELAQGESALILASSKKPRLSGTFQAYDASLGSSR